MLNRNSKTWSCALLCVMAARATLAQVAITQIDAVELGTLGGKESIALDINDHGEIVGWANGSAGTKHAFLYRAGAMEDITPDAKYIAEAQGINNLTQVVGFYSVPGSQARHGFYYVDSQPTVTLDESNPTDPTCGTGATPRAINDSGQITGERWFICAIPFPGKAHPVRWTSYAAPWEELLPNIIPPSTEYAHNINASGVIVGDDPFVYVSITRGFFWKAGTFSPVPVPLGTPPEWYDLNATVPYGINAAGSIVGETSMKPCGISCGVVVQRAFEWDGVSQYGVGLPVFSNGKNAGAHEIDNQEITVGWGDRNIALVGLEKRAALWHHDVGIAMLPLPQGMGPGSTKSPTICEAYAVNKWNAAAGKVQAVGYCQYLGKKEAILWNITTRRVVKTSN